MPEGPHDHTAHEAMVPALLDAPAIQGRLDDWQARYPAFGAALGRSGDLSAGFRRFGLLAWDGGDPALAAEAFVAALSLAPGDAALWADLGGASLAVGRRAEASACLGRSLAIDPAQAPVWLTLASLRSEDGDAPQAGEAYRQALALDPALPAAHLGLGLLAFKARQLDEAATAFQAAVAHGARDAVTLTCLGHVLYLRGDIEEAVPAFEQAAAAGGLDALAQRRLRCARLMVAAIRGRFADAIATLAGEGEVDEAARVDLAREAFAVLSGYGPREGARPVGEWLAARDPDDPVHRYLLEAVREAPLDRAPQTYVEAHFDGFAATFDRTMTDVLRYRGPAALADLLAPFCPHGGDILDLGCGTGLAAPHLARLGARLTGLDLSAAMLAQAERRDLYARLVKAEAVAFLDAHREAFDGILAADFVIYLGDLAPLMRSAAAALRPGGCLVFNIETQSGRDWTLAPSGRFAHAPAYVEALAQADFDLVVQKADSLRIEANRPVAGMNFVFRRRPSQPGDSEAPSA